MSTKITFAEKKAKRIQERDAEAARENQRSKEETEWLFAMHKESDRGSVLIACGYLEEQPGMKKACVAVARKLAIIMHRMWVEGTDFRFGQAPVAVAA